LNLRRGIAMGSLGRIRLGITLTACLLVAASASAQTAANAEHPFGLDPYKPSDAAWLRNYGAVLVAQMPIRDLATLDPYNPTQAALIRQLGGGMPLWIPEWFVPGAPFGPFVPPSPVSRAASRDVTRAAAPDVRRPEDGGRRVTDVATRSPRPGACLSLTPDGCRDPKPRQEPR
jgi:hypothetical protein